MRVVIRSLGIIFGAVLIVSSLAVPSRSDIGTPGFGPATACVTFQCGLDTVVTTEQPIIRRMCFTNCGGAPTSIAYTISDTQGWCTPAADTVLLAVSEQYCLDIVCTPSFQFTGNCPYTSITLSLFDPLTMESLGSCGRHVKFPDGQPELSCPSHIVTAAGQPVVAELCFRNPSMVRHRYAVRTSDLFGWVPSTNVNVWVEGGESYCATFSFVTPADATCATNGLGLLAKMYCDPLMHNYPHCGTTVDVAPPGSFSAPQRVHEAPSDQRTFGWSLTIADDLNADGWPDYAIGSPWDSGAGHVSVFFGGPLADDAPDLMLAGTGIHDGFGLALATGKLNGDGATDLIVGSYANSYGKVSVFWGGSNLDGTADLVIEGVSQDEELGRTVAAGDVNRDGYEDLLAAAKRIVPPSTSATGWVGVYFGGPGLDAIADLEIQDPVPSTGFGDRIAVGGDLDGDGAVDFAVSAGTARRCEVFFGGSDLDAIADLTVLEPPASLGVLLGAIGLWDVNGDRLADLLVGDPWEGAGGHVNMYFGGANPDAELDLTLEPPTNSGAFGSAIAVGEDLDSDGFDDIVVGSPGLSVPGHLRFYRGGPALDATCDAMVAGDVVEDEFGACIAMRGDITGDGIADVLVGAPQHEVAAGTGKGRAYVSSGAVPTDARETDRFTTAPSGLAIIGVSHADGKVLVRYGLGPMPALVRLDIYDIAGRHVRQIANRFHVPGMYSAAWDRRTASNHRVVRGVYVLRLRTEQATASHKLVLH